MWSVNQKIPPNVRNQRVQNRKSHVPTMSYIYQSATAHSMSLTYVYVMQVVPSLQDAPLQQPAFLFPPIPLARPVHLILLDFISRLKFREQHN